MNATSLAAFQTHFSHCEILTERRDLLDDGCYMDLINITPVWKGVDRPKVSGFSIANKPSNLKLAARLKRCIESGAAFSKVEKLTDVNGRTYIGDSCNILARHMNADLKKLGF